MNMDIETLKHLVDYGFISTFGVYEFYCCMVFY